MNTRLVENLARCETDLEGAMRRFADDEELYITCLDAFLLDPTKDELDDAIQARLWDEAFTAAHALKGLAGNMGFIPLFHATGELVVLIRAGRISEIGESGRQVRKCFDEITKAIQNGCDAAGNDA